MQIGTFSVVVDTAACDVACPFCVSKMMAQNAHQDINWRNFDIGCRFARDGGVSTMLLTGKGEPLFLPRQISEYLKSGSKYFPFMELQTNGIRLFDKVSQEEVGDWKDYGLTLVCLSIIHHDERKNADVMRHLRLKPAMYWSLVDRLHDMGLSVRLNCTMVKGGIDTTEKLEVLIDKCKAYDVEHLTFRGITSPGDATNQEVTDWVKSHQVRYTTPERTDSYGHYHFPQEVGGVAMVREYLRERKAVPVLSLKHRAMVYDCEGQNVCINTEPVEPPLKPEWPTPPEEIRQLIFFPDGHLRYDWTYKGAVIL